MPEFNFEEDVAIDLDNLHEEWRTHAQTRYRYAKEVSHLDKVVKQQNKQIEVNKAKLKAEISKLILKIKGENPKATVQMVDAETANHKDLVPAQKELSEAQDKLINLEYDFYMAKNAVKAFDDRKYALQNEVELWKGNYFAGPQEPKEVKPGKRIIDQARDRKVQQIRKVMNQKRRRR